MNVAICDEQYDHRKAVRDMVESWAEETGHEAAINIQTYASSEDLLDAWQSGLRIDMMLLDACFTREMSGIELARSVHQVDMHLPIVFIAGSAEYACQGYEVNALRYLLKPAVRTQVNDCMQIAWDRWEAQQEESLLVTTSRLRAVLPYRSIIYAEASGRSIYISTVEQGVVTCTGTFADFESRLPSEVFARCHRRYLANLQYVRRITSGEVLLVGGAAIPIGRKYAESFQEQFSHYYQGRQW